MVDSAYICAALWRTIKTLRQASPNIPPFNELPMEPMDATVEKEEFIRPLATRIPPNQKNLTDLIKDPQDAQREDSGDKRGAVFSGGWGVTSACAATTTIQLI